MANYVKNNKKKALLARKEKLLEEIQYYQKRINDFDANAKSNPNNFESESSDSDTDLPTFFDTSPPQSLLKLQQASWQTSLQATLELTGLEVLQSEINILTSEPTLEHGPPVEKEGLWHEVALRCKVDRVPFGITFLMHQADGQFGARSYRNVTLIPEKAVHDSELSKSVLNDVTTPADALDVVKSYAAANRSRRTSLAQLAEKYTESLFMEPLTNGGYVLKCADLLEVCWTLVNTWLPMSHFRHRMKFELEYMNESYIKIITHLHRQLSDPSLDTDERTLLLSKIISTCLEAKAPTEELYASVESDPETAQILRKRRTTLDQEVDEPAMKKKKDSEVMAPPKSLPKKAKPKGKENNNLKRPSGGDGTVSKKMKLTDSSKSVNERSEIDGQNEKKSTNADQVNEKGKGKKKTMTEVTNSQNMDNFKENNGTNVEEIKNNVKAKNKNPKSSIKSQIEKNVTTSKRNDEVAVQSCPSKSVKNKVDEDKSTKISKKSNVKNAPATEIYREEALRAHASKSGNKNVDEQSKPKISKNNNAQNVAMAKKNGEEILQASAPKSNKNVNGHANPKVSKKSTVQKNVATSKISAEGSSQARASKSANKNGGELRNLKISRKSDLEKNTTTKNSDEDVTLAGVSKFAYNNAIEDKNLSNKNTAGKVKVSNKDINIDEPVTNAVKLPEKNQKDSNKLKVNEKKSVHTVNNKNINEKNIVDKNNKNKAAVQSIGTTSKLSSQNDKQKVVEKNMAKLKNTAEKVKIAKVMQENNNNATKAIPNKGKTTTNKILSNIQSDGNQKISKIPQKKMSAPVSTMKKNPLRISPRKLPFRMTPQSSTKKIQKPITNIPQLLKKQMPKI